MIILIVLFIWWSSPHPVAPDTQRVIVTGGELQSMTVSNDGLSGAIWIDAPIECASIDWTARTVSGVTLHTNHTWRDECTKVYVPLVGIPQ